MGKVFAEVTGMVPTERLEFDHTYFQNGRMFIAEDWDCEAPRTGEKPHAFQFDFGAFDPDNEDTKYIPFKPVSLKNRYLAVVYSNSENRSKLELTMWLMSPKTHSLIGEPKQVVISATSVAHGYWKLIPVSLNEGADDASEW